MFKQLQRRYQLLLRVIDFGTRHQNDFPATSVAGKAFATVAQAAADIQHQSSERLMSAQAGWKARVAARTALVDWLKAIARAARAANGSELPMPDELRFPKRRSDAALVEAANTFLRYGATDSARWVPFGLPETSVEELRQLMDAFVTGMATRREGSAGVKAARKGITDAFRDGRIAVRHLDVLVANAYPPDSALATAWRDLRRVSPVSHRAKATGDAPVPNAPAGAANQV